MPKKKNKTSLIHLISAPSIQKNFGYSIYEVIHDDGKKEQLAGFMLNSSPHPDLSNYSNYGDPEDYKSIWTGCIFNTHWICTKAGPIMINGLNQRPQLKIV